MSANLKKRHLVALALLLTAFAFDAFAGDSFQTKGFARFRWGHSGNVGTNTVLDHTDLVVAPEFWFKPSAEVAVMLQPQYDQMMGNEKDLHAVAMGSSAGGVDTGLGAHQAFVSYSPNDRYKLTMGRQVVSLGDELLFGEGGWADNGKALSGLRFDASHSMGSAHIFAMTIQENEPFPVASPYDRSLMGLYTTWKLAEEVKAFDVYYFMSKDPAGKAAGAGGTDISSMSVYGARIKAEKRGLDLRFEYTGEKNPNYVSAGGVLDTSGTQMNAELGYTMDGPMKIRVSGEYYDASKDFNQLLANTHKWLGENDLLGRRNISGMAGHVSVSPNADWTFSAAYYMFNRKDAAAAAFMTDGTTAIGLGSANAEKAIATEIDLGASYNVTKNMTFKVAYNITSYGNYIKNQNLFGGATKGTGAAIWTEISF
ncbi:MAG: alginate export family protein [Bdellovibrionota bacterium]